jgi:hypothetical protein
MTTLSGKTQTQCIGRYLIETPVELGSFGIRTSQFMFGLDSDFESVEVGVWDEDRSPEAFATAVNQRASELTASINDGLQIPRLLTHEVWSTPNGKAYMLRYLEEAQTSYSTIRSEVHVLVGKRHATITGESYLEESKKNATTNLARYKYIDPQPMEARLKHVAQNLKGYSEGEYAPEGFCMSGVVMNNKTMGYDVETTSFWNYDCLLPNTNFTIYMPGQFPRDGDPNLHQRAEQTVAELRQIFAKTPELGEVNNLRFNRRNINGMPSLEYAHHGLYKGSNSFKFMVENDLPKEQRSLLRPGFSITLDLGGDNPSPVTQEQALKIWDAMIDSMRLSPANGGYLVNPATGNVDTAPTALSQQPAPRTGVYRGSLPEGNPRMEYFKDIKLNYAYVEAGQNLPRLGMNDEEHLVTWTWIRATR